MSATPASKGAGVRATYADGGKVVPPKPKGMTPKQAEDAAKAYDAARTDQWQVRTPTPFDPPNTTEMKFAEGGPYTGGGTDHLTRLRNIYHEYCQGGPVGYEGGGLIKAGASILKSSGISDLLREITARNPVQGKRFEQAADSTDLTRFNPNALRKTFATPEAGLYTTMPPSSFGDLTPKFSDTYAAAVPYGRFNDWVPARKRGPVEGRTRDAYLDFLGNVAQTKGLDEPPRLWLSARDDMPFTQVNEHEGRHRAMALDRMRDDSTLVHLLPSNIGELNVPIEDRIKRLNEKYFPQGNDTPFARQGASDDAPLVQFPHPVFAEGGPVNTPFEDDGLYGAPNSQFNTPPSIITEPPAEAYAEGGEVPHFGEGGGILKTIARSIIGKPDKVKLPGIGEIDAHPISQFEDIAHGFAARNGNALPGSYPDFDEARARRIASAYDAMEHAPHDPEVKRAYEALIDETMDQYKALKGTGVDFSFLKPGEADPYAKSPALGYHDLLTNGRLKVFPTDQGFGSLHETHDNPLMQRVGPVGDLPDGTANDAFRAVHDALGHFGPGNPFFRSRGEERAFLAHAPTFSDDALRAATPELRGQNSWVNYGPHAEHNRTASGADTIYADQKTGLMPDWASDYAHGGSVDFDLYNTVLDSFAHGGRVDDDYALYDVIQNAFAEGGLFGGMNGQ